MIKRVETEMVWNGEELTRDMFNEIQGALGATADKVAGEARARVPIGPGDPMHLKDTIRARSQTYARAKLRSTIHALAGGKYETAQPAAFVFAGDRDRGVYWAHMVEYGTYESPAHPFLRPAVYGNFNALIAECDRAGKRAVNRRRRARDKARRDRVV